MKNPLTVSELIHKLSAMSGDAKVATFHGSLAITDVKAVGYEDIDHG